MTSPIEQFAKAAAEFCAWAEDKPGAPEDEARLAHQHLSSLYQLALQLPPQFGDEQSPEISSDAWQSVYRRFGALPFNYYAQFFDPQVVPPEDAGIADLADDLADIWRDLKKGLVLFNAGHVPAAAWEWRQGFWQHWGHHAVGGLYALHCWFAEHPKSAVA